MGLKYIWDTNTVIYFLQQQFPLSAENFMDDLLSKSQPVISVITEIELLCWKTTDERDMEILQNFIDDVRVIEMEKTIKYKAVDIRKK